MTDHALSRRGLLRGGAALAAAAASATALSGCGNTIAQGFTGAPPASRRVNFWNPFTGGDGARMVAMVDAYKKAHPRNTLKATTFVWGNPYYTKLSLSAVGDRPPQVAIAHLSKVPVLAEAGLLRELREDELAKHGMTPDKFDTKPWKKAHYGGKLQAVPLDTHPFVLYSRTDLAKKAGLLDGDGKLTDLDGPDKFIDALKAMQEVTKGFGLAIASNKDPSTQFRLFYSFYRQLGGTPLVTDNGLTVQVDMAAAEEALAFIRRLATEKVVPTGSDGAGAITMLTTGKAGFLFDGVWQVISVQESKVKFDMQPVPRIFSDAPYACFADSHALVLPKASTEEAQRLDLSLQFCGSLLQSSAEWAAGGHVPAWLPTQQSAAYKKLEPQSHYTAAADGAVYDPVAWYGGAGSNLQVEVGDATIGALKGYLSPKAGAERIRSELKKLASVESPI
ncbi:extracellular solute-binding protein [Streptomyces sp. A7024]|uniref:Extracellular solute-binding protein n=1 Tax=Streptomyces coryli TaxID=1128680 RepID=A0A6G4TTL7_9ACTN|nr:extracellular solute-binding protein [Streptomyces coryli]NGN63214.1 extracellular solute-binding protein [Streptomyces coryli]